MSDNRKQNIFLIIASVLAGILSVVGFISASKSTGVIRTLMIICSVLLLILIAIYIIIVAISKEKEQNFFLSDDKTGKNISVNKLTPDIVYNKIDDYIQYLGGGRDLIVRQKLVDSDFGIGNVLKPLVVYRFLQMSANDTDLFGMLENADNKIFDDIYDALMSVSENHIVDAIKKHREFSTDSEGFRKYLSANHKYIQNRMILYIKSNIEQFY